MVIRVRMLNEKRTFFQKHKSLMALLGTAIVFGTFVANEYFKDAAAELANSVGRAQETFRILTEVQIVSDDVLTNKANLYAIEEQLNAPHVRPKRLQPPSDKVDSDVAEAETMYPFIHEYGRRLQVTLDLLEKLPYDKKLDETHWLMMDLMTKEFDFLTDAQDIRTFRATKQIDELNVVKAKEEVRKKYIRIIFDKLGSGVISSCVNSFQYDVLTRALDVQKQAEDWGTTWKHVSFILYPLGLILGLIGRLSGDDDSIGEEAAG